jgi:RNA-directed DNA polymerase
VSKLLPILIAGTGLSEFDIMKIVSNAPRRYKTYSIEKRSVEGRRIISQPAVELKALQRTLTSGFLSELPVHPSAMAYRPGVSIRDNAAAHAQNGPIFKFDFKDFFPSIRSTDWHSYCAATGALTDHRDLWISTNIFFHQASSSTRLTLAIGAPSSPSLSNILMREFDEKISREVKKDQVTYTRYADDLTFSAKRTGYLTRVESTLRRIIREIGHPFLTLNEKKAVRATKKYKRFVTGLVLTNDGQVSIGQSRKRELRAGLHRYSQNKLSTMEQARLAGRLAFVYDVEPKLFYRFQQKYGADLIQALRLTRVLRSVETDQD